jgi:hypothetical protein
MKQGRLPFHDALAIDVLDALAAGTHLPKSWLEDKRAELAGLTRFEVLQWLVRLDGFHLSLVADRMRVSPENLRIAASTVYRWY